MESRSPSTKKKPGGGGTGEGITRPATTPRRKQMRAVRADSEKPAVFLAWSKERSRRAADVLKGFFDSLLPDDVDVFISNLGIASGSDWFAELCNQLNRCNVLVACVTPENSTSPWLHFEAGYVMALGKPVCVLLLGDADLKESPLKTRQTKHLDDFFQVARAVASAVRVEINERRFKSRFDEMWPPKYNEVLKALETRESDEIARSNEITSKLEVIEELVRRCWNAEDVNGSRAAMQQLSPESLAAISRGADQAFDLGDFGEADKLYSDCYTATKNPVTGIRWARALARQGQLDRAIDLLTTVEAQMNKSSSAIRTATLLWNRACYRAMRNTPQALEQAFRDIKQALAIQPSFAEDLATEAQFENLKGRPEWPILLEYAKDGVDHGRR